MPKFRHGKACGVKYSTRAVGFWRRFSFFFLPYMTGDVIFIHLKLQRVLDWWPEAILRIDPPVMSDKPILGEVIRISDFPFEIKEIPIGKTWSETLALKGAVSFGQPCHIKCYVDLQRQNGNKIERCSLYVADIEIVSRWLLIAWSITTLFALSAIILHFIAC